MKHIKTLFLLPLIIICFSCFSFFEYSEEDDSSSSETIYVEGDNFYSKSYSIEPINYESRKIKTDKKIEIRFTYTGEYELSSYLDPENIDYWSYERSDKYTRLTKKGDVYTCTVMFPSVGKYTLSIHGSESSNQSSYFIIGSYEIDVFDVSKNLIINDFDTEEKCLKYGLTMDSFNQKKESVTVNKMALFSFIPDPAKMPKNGILYFELQKNRYYYYDKSNPSKTIDLLNKKEAEKYDDVFSYFTDSGVHKRRVHVTEKDGEYRVHVSFPFAEDYKLLVSGKNEKGDTLHLCTYKINAKSGTSLNGLVEKYPDAIILDQQLFDELGFSYKSISQKKITAEVNDTFSVSFQANQNADVIAEYYFGCPHQYRTKKSVDKGKYAYSISFPAPGTYKLTIKGRVSDKDEYKEILQYEVTAKKAMPLDTFEAMYKIDSEQNAHSDKLITIKMKNFDLNVVAYFEKRDQKMAEYYLGKMASYLPALEEYTDYDFYDTMPYDSDNTVADFIGLYLNRDAKYPQWYGSIELAKRETERKMPALLLHECGHAYNPAMARWFFEGTASFYSVALYDYGLIDDKTITLDKINTHWRFKDTSNKKDDILTAEGLYESQFSFFYTKTFKVQYLIYKELGKENYRDCIRAMLRGELEGEDFDFMRMDDDIAKFLEKYKKINWRYFLQGWVFEGPYTRFSFEDFKDKDKNKKPDIVDFYEKNPDGVPLNYGYDL